MWIWPIEVNEYGRVLGTSQDTATMGMDTACKEDGDDVLGSSIEVKLWMVLMNFGYEDDGAFEWEDWFDVKEIRS
ncbi:hypothetical protein Tco_1135026 [Tanacetum coccineum]